MTRRAELTWKRTMNNVFLIPPDREALWTHLFKLLSFCYFTDLTDRPYPVVQATFWTQLLGGGKKGSYDIGSVTVWFPWVTYSSGAHTCPSEEGGQKNQRPVPQQASLFRPPKKHKQRGGPIQKAIHTDSLPLPCTYWGRGKAGVTVFLLKVIVSLILSNSCDGAE